MILTTRTIGISTLVAFVAGIGLSMAFNLWITSPVKVPARIAEGEFAGAYDPADIRGSYSFADIEKAFGLPAADLARAFALDAAGQPGGNAGTIQVKDLESMYGEVDGPEIGTASVRLFVALWTGLPYTPNEKTGLLPEAIEVLSSRLEAADLERARTFVIRHSLPDNPASSTMTPADSGTGTQAAPRPTTPAPSPAATAGTSNTGAAVPAKPATKTSPAPSTEASPAAPAQEKPSTQSGAGQGGGTPPAAGEKSVRGSTTFGDLLSWGLSRDQVEKVLGGVGDSSETVRNWLSAKGLEFSTYKTELQAIVDSLP